MASSIISNRRDFKVTDKKHTAASREEADRLNLQILLAGGMDRETAMLIIDVVNHFGNQIDDLVMRTLKAMPNGHCVPVAAALMGVTMQRTGAMMQETINDHYGVGRRL